MQGQQVAQGINGHMPFAPPLAFGPIGARAGSDGAGLQGPRIIADGLEYSGTQPALGLLVPGYPRWQVVRRHPPRGPARTSQHSPLQISCRRCVRSGASPVM